MMAHARLMKKSGIRGMKKRLLSLAMAFSLIVGMVPARSSAYTGAQQTQSAGVAYGRGQSPSAAPHHAALNDRVFDSEESVDSVHSRRFEGDRR